LGFGVFGFLVFGFGGWLSRKMAYLDAFHNSNLQNHSQTEQIRYTNGCRITKTPISGLITNFLKPHLLKFHGCLRNIKVIDMFLLISRLLKQVYSRNSTQVVERLCFVQDFS